MRGGRWNWGLKIPAPKQHNQNAGSDMADPISPGTASPQAPFMQRTTSIRSTSSSSSNGRSLLRWTSHRARQEKSNAQPVSAEESSVSDSDSDAMSTSVASLSSTATAASHTSIEEDTDTDMSESDADREQPAWAQTDVNVERPFLYPVPHEVTAQVSAASSGYNTPRATSFSTLTPRVAEFSQAQIVPTIPAPKPRTSRPSLALPKTPVLSTAPQRFTPKRHPSVTSSIPPPLTLRENVSRTPLESARGMDYFSITPLRIPRPGFKSPEAQGSNMSPRVSSMPMDHENVPPTPSAIISRRSSMAGAPMMWMTTPSNPPSGSTTPTTATPLSGGSLRSSVFLSGPLSPALVSPVTATFSEDTAVPQSPLSMLPEGIVPERMPRFDAATNINPLGGPTPASQNSVPLWQRRQRNSIRTLRGLTPTQALTPKEAEIAREDEEAHDLLVQANASLLQTQVQYELLEEKRRAMSLLTDDRPSLMLMGAPTPRDGEERLPPYSCTVHIEGFLPRKMELLAPEMPATTRAWTTQYFVVHGTVLHVYDIDVSALYTKSVTPSSVWNLDDGPLVHKLPKNQDVHIHDLMNGRVQSSSHTSPTNLISLESILQQSLQMNNGDALDQGEPADPTETWEKIKQALKEHHAHSYSLEEAQCGLAADYTKRDYVIRVKVGGEQFLLQTRNNYDLVDWIEVLQAANNVSTDLDSRMMPKFITLPRRRRRRGGQETVTIRGSTNGRSSQSQARSSLTSQYNPPPPPLMV
ncbi:hypothetical protein ACI68E_002065 [Malassezia pachydermatis]